MLNDVLAGLKEKGIYKFRTYHGMIVPYLDLQFDIRAVQGITLSPMLNDEVALKGISKFMEYSGYDVNKLKYSVKESNIP